MSKALKTMQADVDELIKGCSDQIKPAEIQAVVDKLPVGKKYKGLGGSGGKEESNVERSGKSIGGVWIRMK